MEIEYVDGKRIERYYIFVEGNKERDEEILKLEYQNDVISSVSTEESPLRLGHKFREAEKLLTEKKYSEGILLCDEILTSRPSFVGVLFMRGLMHQSSKNYLRAKEDYQSVLALDGEKKSALIGMASVLAYEKDFDSSLAIYDKIIASEPDNMYFFYNRGMIKLQKGDLKEGLFDIDRSVKGGLKIPDVDDTKAFIEKARKDIK